jgi:hypothetical protein
LGPVLPIETTEIARDGGNLGALLEPVELNERSLVAVNNVRAVVRMLGKVEQHEKGFLRGSNDLRTKETRLM